MVGIEVSQYLYGTILKGEDNGTTAAILSTVVYSPGTFFPDELTGHLETDATIWNNIRHPDLRRQVQNFLFKAMSGALRIGDFWSKIPTYEHRTNCTHCPDALETLDHILTECTHPATCLIWNLVKQKWPNNEHNWPNLHQGHILGCGSIQPNTDNDNEDNMGKKRGVARLKQILLSELAYLIWTLCCERTIVGTTYPQ